MAAFASGADLVQGCLGTVYVQPDEGPAELTLYVCRHARLGLMLADIHGISVNPKSSRAGWNGRRGSSNRLLVCDDDVTEDTRDELIRRGYQNVVPRG